MDFYQILGENNLVWTKGEMAAAVLTLAVVLLIAFLCCKKQKMNVRQAVCLVLLTFFLLLVVTSTVFGRNPGKRRYNLTLFWSYTEIALGSKKILWEVLLNVVFLIPAGVLLPLVYNRPLRWYHGLLFGILISGTVEVLQLITCRGLFEFDDIFHNTLGCMAGCILCSKLLRKR